MGGASSFSALAGRLHGGHDRAMSEADRGQVNTAAAEVYEAFFVPALFGQWTKPVLDAAGVATGDRVLDVGCGTGILARAAAARVGPEGSATGLDPNAGMLGVAAHAAPDIDWRTGAAEELPFDDAVFDRVVSQFAAMFFTDHERAACEMARVLAPGGRIAVAVWGPLDETPGYAAMVELLADVVDDAAADALRAPFVLGDPEQLTGILSTAFTGITVARHDGAARFDSIDAWVHTDIRGWTLADRIDGDRYDVLLGEARRRLRRFTGSDGGVEFPAPALIACAHR
jgi:ubiquinone/menaquinone biosynthesis C-methylase UbiE